MPKLRKWLVMCERVHILRTLYAYDWDKAKAAKALGIGLSSLYRKIVRLKIKRPRTVKISTLAGTIKMETGHKGTIEAGAPLYLCNDGKASPRKTKNLIGKYIDE